MANNQRNVRQRTDDDTFRISDLPDSFLVNVSEYLPKPSKAMLAVALSAPSPSWNVDSVPSDASRAVVSSERWDILDFEETKELANKLTDNNINAVLICISARDVLKKLKLCGCINIIGHGLSPLRASVILEQIDISLAGKYEKPTTIPRSKISQAAVVPILDSIISADGCSLKCIQYPSKWYNSDEVERFRERYNQQFNINTRGLSCAKCNGSMRGDQNDNIYWPWNNQHASERTCYECLIRPVCLACSAGENDEGFSLYGCYICDKMY